MNGVTIAIEKVGLAGLAEKCGVSYQAVRKWEKGKIPAERAVQVNQLTRVPLYKLRPDLWPRNTGV